MAETSTGTQAVDRAAQLVSTVVHADAPAHLRRPAGGERTREVDDVADAHGAGAHRPGRARRLRVVRRRQPLLAVRRPPRPVGGAGPAGPPRDGADRRGHPRDRAPERDPRREGRPGRPGRLPLPARHPRLDRDRGPGPHLGARQGLLRLGSPARPDRRARAADRVHHRRPPRRCVATASPPARAAGRSPTTSSRSASPASPYPSRVHAATWSPPSASRDPPRGSRTGSTSSAATCRPTPQTSPVCCAAEPRTP